MIVDRVEFFFNFLQELILKIVDCLKYDETIHWIYTKKRLKHRKFQKLSRPTFFHIYRSVCLSI